jgi:type 1 fimbriae regulatory protein FimB/type 1 fimbriae regulatory protein FimE
MLVDTKVPVDEQKPEMPTVAKSPVLRRGKNSEYRTREYLTVDEIGALMKAAKSEGRYGHRDATMILVAYNHGLRVKELTRLEWTHFDFKAGTVYVVRAKKGQNSTHPLSTTEIRALKAIQKENLHSRFVFMNERGAPVSIDGFQKTMARLSQKAGLSFQAHPHMLRHSCGYKHANDGKDTRALQHYLGHKNIQHTVRYTELSAKMFDGWLKD